MRIQCKGCGKEYQVDQKRVSPEGIRVKCRSCGAVLLVRLREQERSTLKKDKGDGAVKIQESGGQAQPMAPEAEPEPLTTPVVPKGAEPQCSEYHYCMQCGKNLDRRIAENELPVCSTCTIMTAADTGQQNKIPLLTRKRVLFILLALLLSAFVAYRMAMGHSSSTLTMNSPCHDRSLFQGATTAIAWKELET